MARHLDRRLWLLVLALAVALTVACSSSSAPTPAGGDDGPSGPSSEPASDAMTQG